MSSRTTFLLTSLLLHPLYVTCLRCYVGVEGAGNVTEVDVENPQTHMCSFMVRGACSFPDKDPPVYTVYIKDKVYSRRCWYGDGVAVCSCMTDLCNGDIELIRRLWDKTKITDENVHECVSEYLKRWQDSRVLKKEEMEQENTDIVPVINEEQPERQRIWGIQEEKKPNTKTENKNKNDFIIFLVLVIVAVVLLIAIIPACIGCMALNKKRKQKREEYVSLKTGKSTGGRSERSNKSTKSTTSVNSLKSGKSRSTRRGGRHANSTRSRSEAKRSLASGRNKEGSSRRGRK